MSPNHDDLPESPNCVTIFGAGIAGLTAAHELVERGFQVQVWEPRGNDRFPERGCDVGGLARTQWGSIGWPMLQDLSSLPSPTQLDGANKELPLEKRTTSRIEHFPIKFYFERGMPRLITQQEREMSFRQLIEELTHRAPKSVTATVATYGTSRLPPGEAQRRLSLILSSEFGRRISVAVKEGGSTLTAEFPLGDGPSASLCVLLTESQNPDVITITIETTDAHGAVESGPTLEARWVPGALSTTFGAPEDVVKDLLARIDARPDVDTWYVEATADERGMSRKEFARRADLIRKRFAALSTERFGPIEEDQSGQYFFCPVVSGARIVKLVLVALGALAYPATATIDPDIEVVIGLRPRERWIPGEHGYRFFPSFYHHLFDTMKRTPLLDIEDKSAFAQAQERAAGVRIPAVHQYVETGRTAFDNLHPTTRHVLAQNNQRPSQLSRSRVRSLEELRAYFNLAFGSAENGGLGINPRDLGRLMVKLLQFATACDGRRADYSLLSWYEFIEADTLEESTRDLLTKWPEALVAMNAKESDARTQWVPFIQLLIDQVRPDTYRDGTLRGPTNEAWLNPWRTYLEAQGVEFIHGALVGFELNASGRVWPKVDCFDLRHPTQAIDSRNQPELRPGYFVVAVPTWRIGALAEKFCAAAGKNVAENSDFTRASTLARTSTAELDKPRPQGELRHFAGIQFYFAEDVFWMDGHVYFPDSQWQLTSVSQARFWQGKMDWEHGYRGVLSVSIATWDQPGEYGKPAWKCTRGEIARDVWAQIKKGLDTRRTTRAAVADGSPQFQSRTEPGDLPEPLFWHLDEGLTFDETNEHLHNWTPFFIANAGRFDERPGSLKNGYMVEHGFLIAGHHTQTYTRLPCMEGANESARHAVNAILKQLADKNAKSHQYRRAFCDVWSPEDREVEDLLFLKQLDAKLLERGRPHLLEIFELDYLMEHLLRGGSKDPLDPLKLLSKLRRLYEDRGAQP